jgi:glycine cleavage system T protein
MKPLPKHSQVVVIGGGIVGCSVAYHLTKVGFKEVTLLERKVLTCGTTWAAAGLVGQLRATEALTKLARYGTELYARLEDETEQYTGYKSNGSLMVARTKDRVHEYERSRAMANAFGVQMERVDMAEAKRLWPLMSTDGLEAAYWFPKDGYTNPVDTAQALAKGARMGGASIHENVEVLDIKLKNSHLAGVVTDKGEISCEYVVNCTGMWSRFLGLKSNISLPVHAAEHMHVITKPIEGVTGDLPTLRDMDGYIYFREEVGGLLMGGFEPVAKPWGTNSIPELWQFNELNEDWDQFSIFMDKAIERVPVMETAEIRHLTVVPESFTPDTAYMIGEVPGLTNYFVACGMNSVGIASAGGVGKAVAEWMAQGYPGDDLWDADVRRFFPDQVNSRYLRDRMVEAVGNLYADHYPFKQPHTARNFRKSVLHDRLAENGACFGVVAGWERANWFAPEGMTPEYKYSWDRQNWFNASAEEHLAVRKDVGLYDLSSMAQFLLQGKDVESVAQKICANNVAVRPGNVVYTQLLNERGGIEADVTFTRLDDETYFIVTAGATETRDFDWIKRHIPSQAHAVLTNVTSSYTMLGLMGPKSRDVLSQLTNSDLSNEKFPYGTARFIEAGYARPLAVRMSFAGELGWELYIPTEFAVGLFDEIMTVGRDYGLKLVGLHAVDSLRLEKGYRHWGSDIGPENTPFEAGLGFSVDLSKEDFIGREALLKQKEQGLTRRLVMFTLNDPQPLLYHDEPVFRNGTLVGTNTHGAYAHLLGASMGMFYLENPEGIDKQWIMEAEYEVDVEGRLIAAKPYLAAPYDPERARVRM